MIRRIRELLYEEGFTINGARNRLDEMTPATARKAAKSDTSGLRDEIKAIIELLRL